MKKTNVNLCINKKTMVGPATNSNSFALVERINRKGSLLYQLFPINHRTKYPIFFENLLERIHNLKTNYNYNKFYSIKVYQNLELNRKILNKELKDKGGIYI
jgi:hypothetical protein